MINVSTVAPDFRQAQAVIGIRGGNLENTHTINVANASAMEQEKGNDWHNLSITKLKHTVAN
jgi:hypothetical protein